MVFAINCHRGADFGPIIKLGDFGGFHIDTAMGHGDAKIIVPIGAVKAVADFFCHLVVVEKHNVGNVGKIVISAGFFGTAGHFLGADFGPDGESTGRGAVVLTGGNDKIKDFLAVFVSIKVLVSQINLDFFRGVGVRRSSIA